MSDVIQGLFDQPMSVAPVTTVPSGGNTVLVPIQLVNANGRPLASPVIFDIWLSDNATGFPLTATTASGAVGGQTNGTTGQDLTVEVASKALRVMSTATGGYVLSITDTAHTPLFVFVGIPLRAPKLVATLSAGSY